MNVVREKRNDVTLRTLESLDKSLKRFRDDGGDLGKAKEFNNVIEERIFNIPLDQVSKNLL